MFWSCENIHMLTEGHGELNCNWFGCQLILAPALGIFAAERDLSNWRTGIFEANNVLSQSSQQPQNQCAKSRTRPTKASAITRL
jgi:hypothetical protein